MQPTGFWGGLVPENAFNSSALEGLLNAGALGLKVTISEVLLVVTDHSYITCMEQVYC